MKRRIAFVLTLVIWVLLGKAMALSQSRGDVAINECVEQTLAKNLQKQFGLNISYNFRMLSCESGAKECHQAQFQAFAEDGSLFHGAVSVTVDQAGNCSLASNEKRSLTVTKIPSEDSARLADTE